MSVDSLYPLLLLLFFYLLALLFFTLYFLFILKRKGKNFSGQILLFGACLLFHGAEDFFYQIDMELALEKH